MIVNLISDTVTKPSPAMLLAMMNAEVGDDVFREDPTVNRLEAMAAKMFGKEAALFCPSGTMTNQIAINRHTEPLDEVICDHYSHVYQYETGGPAFNSGVSMNLIAGKFGKITPEQIEAAIKPDFDWLPRTRLVVLENTTNKGGGNFYTLSEIKPIAQLCEKRNLKLHLDGARLFNALVETNESTEEMGSFFDSVSICLSKGLGAPVGSLLIGNEDFIKGARRVRKVLGGGMRQVGILAAAGIYALENNIDRLREDNERARIIGEHLQTLNYISDVRPVKSNILIFDVEAPLTASTFVEKIGEKGVLAVPFGEQTVRFVTHLNFTEKMLERTLDVLNGV